MTYSPVLSMAMLLLKPLLLYIYLFTLSILYYTFSYFYFLYLFVLYLYCKIYNTILSKIIFIHKEKGENPLLTKFYIFITNICMQFTYKETICIDKNINLVHLICCRTLYHNRTIAWIWFETTYYFFV